MSLLRSLETGGGVGVGRMGYVKNQSLQSPVLEKRKILSFKPPHHQMSFNCVKCDAQDHEFSLSTKYILLFSFLTLLMSFYSKPIHILLFFEVLFEAKF